MCVYARRRAATYRFSIYNFIFIMLPQVWISVHVLQYKVLWKPDNFLFVFTLNQFQFLNLSNGMYTNVGSNLSSGTGTRCRHIKSGFSSCVDVD